MNSCYRWILLILILGQSACILEKPWVDFATVEYKNDSQQVCVAISESEGKQNTNFYIMDTSVSEEKRGKLWQQFYEPGGYAVKRGECIKIPVQLTELGTYTVLFGSVTTPSSFQDKNKKLWMRRFETKMDETGKPVLTMIQ